MECYQSIHLEFLWVPFLGFKPIPGVALHGSTLWRSIFKGIKGFNLPWPKDEENHPSVLWKKWTQGDEWWIWSHHGSTWKQHVGMVGNGGNRFLSRTHWATELRHSLVGKPIHPSPICAMDCHGPNMVRNGMVLRPYQHKSTITKDSWWWLYQSCVNPMTSSFWRQNNTCFYCRTYCGWKKSPVGNY